MKSWRPWKITNWYITLAALVAAVLVYTYVFRYTSLWPDDIKCFLATVIAFYLFEFLFEAGARIVKRSRKNQIQVNL
jgi:hypothetical protein